MTPTTRTSSPGVGVRAQEPQARAQLRGEPVPPGAGRAVRRDRRQRQGQQPGRPKRVDDSDPRQGQPGAPGRDEHDGQQLPGREAAPGGGLEVAVRPGHSPLAGPAQLVLLAGRADQARHDGAEPGLQHGGADAEPGGQREHRPDAGYLGERQGRHRLHRRRRDQHPAGRQPVEQQARQGRERGDGDRDREEHRGDRPGVRALVDAAGQRDQDQAVPGGDDCLQANGQPQRVPRRAG
ncbi:MAG TPA: hypothetical protein VEH31_45405 [Streptosporangiaceae bacterium]|nr:hypothetical protein [Streptosporangiaceae bacterium]